jgi:polyisoprenoid-binding protein YceI
MPQFHAIRLAATILALAATSLCTTVVSAAVVSAPAVAAGVSVAPKSAAADVTRSADLASSSVSMSVSELVFAKVRGTIAITSASIVTPAATNVPRQVDVTLDATSTSTGDPKRNADLRSGKFFDAEHYPTITFNSGQIVGTNPAKFQIHGNLTIRGISRPITFDTHVAGTRTDANGKLHVRYVAVGSFRRSSYGITYARGIVGDNVTLNVVIDAVG